MIEDYSGAYARPPGKLILFTAQLPPRASISLQLDLQFAHYHAPKQFEAFSLLTSFIRGWVFPLSAQYITIKHMSGDRIGGDRVNRFQARVIRGTRDLCKVSYWNPFLNSFGHEMTEGRKNIATV